MSNNPSKLTASNLAALMCARICHDLVSPVGALGAALEVLDDETSVDMHEDAMDLVRTSARQASHKLKYLRLAFGAGSSAPGVLSVDQLREMVDDMYGQGKAEIVWDADVDGVEKTHGRLLLNMVMIALQSIPRGGELKIDMQQKSDACLFNLTATGPKARLYAEFERSLSGKAPEDGFDGRTIQPFYTGLLTREMGGRIDSSIDGEKVTFTAFVPIKRAQNAA